MTGVIELSTMLLEFLIIIILFIEIFDLKKSLKKLNFSKLSMSVKHGKTMEELAPFMKTFPYNPENFRFIGSPIDGIQFDNDKIVFVEFKTGNSKLSERQKNIKKVIDNGKVYFKEIDMG